MWLAEIICNFWINLPLVPKIINATHRPKIWCHEFYKKRVPGSVYHYPNRCLGHSAQWGSRTSHRSKAGSRAETRSQGWRRPSSWRFEWLPTTPLHRASPPSPFHQVWDPVRGGHDRIGIRKAAEHRHSTPSTGRLITNSEMSNVSIHTFTHTHTHLGPTITQRITGPGTNYSWSAL